nr:Gag-Pol polyprotein [Tanacetum cinerariifolium]
MTSLADKAILSGADNRPPMLEKDMYDYWKSRMELYMLNRQHGRMILESVENGLLVLVFQKGDDLIDAINHMMSFLTAVVTLRYPPTNNQLRNSSNPRQQATINNARVTIQPIQGRQIFLSAGICTKINQDNKNVNEILTAELKRYKDQIDNLKHTLFEHLKEKESLEQMVTLLKNDFQKEESRNIYRELALEKQAQQLEPKLYDGSVIQKTDAIVIRDSEETLMLEDESQRIKSLSGNVKEEKIKRDLEETKAINIELDHRVTKLVAENEHLKQTYNVQEKVLVITALKDTLRKLKGKDVVNEAVTLHSIDPELLKIDVAPLAPKLQNNRTSNNNYLKHTQEETATQRDIVENERLLNPLNTSLDYAYIRHRCLSHQNFGAINNLARQGLVRGLPKLKFKKDHLCSACAMGKSYKKSHKPKSEDTNEEKLYLLHMDLCGPMRVESVNGKKYILVIVDDYS